MIEYVMYQKTQTTDIGNNLNFEDEEFDLRLNQMPSRISFSSSLRI